MLPFDWDIHVGDVVEDKIDKNFVSIFADVFDERLRFEGFPSFVCYQSIFRKRVIKIIDGYHTEN